MQPVPENKARFLSANDILAVDDLPSRDVEVPEWGGFVTVRGLTAGERVEFAGIYTEEDMPRDAQALLAQMAMVNKDGSQMFTKDQVEALSGKSADALSRVTSVAMELSGMAEDSGKN